MDLVGIVICAVIVGSLSSIARRVLVTGMLRIWVPPLVASAAALLAGTLPGLAVGVPARQVLLRVLLPAMGIRTGGDPRGESRHLGNDPAGAGGA